MSLPWILTCVVASLLPPFSTAMSLFDPISTSAPLTGFQRRAHPVTPSCVSPSTTTVGTPTQKFWSNLYLQPGTDPIFPNPFALRLKTESPWGWEISHTMVKGTSPGIGNGQPGCIEYYFNPFLSNWAFSVVEHVNTKPTLEIPSFDLMCVQLKMSSTSAPQGNYQIPLCYGNTYITVEYTSLTPLFSTMHALLMVNGKTPSSHTGTRFVISLNSGQTWIMYTQTSITLLKNAAGQLQASAPYNGWIQITLSPNDAGTSILDTYAGTYVKGVTLDATVSGSIGTYSHIYTLGGNAARPVLHYLLPHHQAIVTTGVKTSLSLPSTTKGVMYAYTTSSGFIFQEALPTEMNFLPSLEPSETDLAITLWNLESDLNSITAEWVGMDGSNYFGAKHLQKLAMLCLLADKYVSRVGATVRATCVSRLEQAFAYWLEWRNGNVLRYDTIWGGIIGQNGLDLDGADFYSTYYNDHHYHWGYVLVSASTLVKLNPSWATPANIEFINTLVRDVSNPSTLDPYFPRFRSFDFYNGHSWSRGILTTPDGKDQESTSEEVNYHYGLALWGMMTSNQQLQDWGRLMFAIASRSIRSYFLMEASNTAHPANFIGNKVTGIFFEAKAHYATWFGANHWFIHGIQMLPMIPWTPMVRTKQFVAEEWVVVKRFLAECMASDSKMWASTLLLNLALIDKRTAFAFLADPTLQFDDGLTRTWALYFASTQDNTNVPTVPQDAIAPPPVTVPPYPTVPTGTRPPVVPPGNVGGPPPVVTPDTTIDTPSDVERLTFVAAGLSYTITASLSGACRTITLTLTAPADVTLTSVQYMTVFSASVPMTDISQPGCSITGSASSLTCSMGAGSNPLYLYVMWNVDGLNYRQQYPLPMPNVSPFTPGFVFQCSGSTQAPVTQAPATQAPVTQAPVTQAPATQKPVTQAPVTQAPVTQAPATQAPVTQAPVTQAPPASGSSSQDISFTSSGTAYTVTASLNSACNSVTLTLRGTGVTLTSVQFMTAYSSSTPMLDISQPGCTITGSSSSLSCSMPYRSGVGSLYAYVMWNVVGVTYRMQQPLPIAGVSPFLPPFVLQCGAPATQAPATQAPVTQAPATQAPVTQAPATKAPVTSAPVTQAPATQAPVTQAPATQRPTLSATSPPTSTALIFPFTAFGSSYTVTGTLNVACDQVTLSLSVAPGVTLTAVTFMVAYATIAPTTDISQFGCTASGSASTLSCNMAYKTGSAPLYVYTMWNAVGVSYRMQQPLPMPGASPFFPAMIFTCGGSTQPEPVTLPPTPAPATQAPATQAPTTKAPATQSPTTKAPATQAPTAAPTAAPTTKAPATQAPTTIAPVSSDPAPSHVFTSYGSSYTITGRLNSACDTITLTLSGTGITLTAVTFMTAWSATTPTTDISQPGCSASGSAGSLSCTIPYKNAPLYLYAMWNAVGVGYRMQHPLPMPGVSPFLSPFIFTCSANAVQPGEDTDGAMACPTLCPLYSVPPVVTSFTSQLKHPYTAIMTLTNGCTNPEHTFTLVSRDDQHLTSLGVYIAYDGQCDITQRDCSQRVCYTSTTLGAPSISCTFSGRPQGYTSRMYVYFLWTTESQSGNQQYPLPAPAFIDINLPCDQMSRTGWDGTCTDTSAITTCSCRTGYFGLACQSQQPIYTSSSSETQDDTIIPIVQSRSTATESASYLTPLLLSTAIALSLAGVGTFLFKRHKSRRAAMEMKPYSLTIENVEYNPVRRVDSTTFSPSVHSLIPSRSTDQLISPSSSIDPMISPASAALQMESNYSSSDSP